MVYAVMIAIESGIEASQSLFCGRIEYRTQQAILMLIQQSLIACGDLGGPKVHRLDFKSMQVTVERVGESERGHEDKVVVKSDGIFAKVEIPPEGPELLDWDRLRVVVDEN